MQDPPYVFPSRPVPFAGESILGYFKRLADLYDFDNVATLISRVSAEDLLTIPFSGGDPTLAAALGDQWNSLKDALLLEQAQNCLFFRGHEIPRDLLHMPTMRICPKCLEDKAYHRQIWLFGPISACHEHDVKLTSTCSHCSAELRWTHGGMLKCPSCQTELVLTQANDASTEEVSCATFLDALSSAEPTRRMPNHPQILVGLKLADVIDFLTFLGRLKECAEAGHNPSGRPNAAAIAQYVTNGFSAAFRWPVSFHEFLDTLRDRKPWNGKTEASALNFFGGFYKSIMDAPIKTWGGRTRSAFIDYLGIHQHIRIETKSPISKIVLKMKAYVDARQAMAILDVDEQGFAELQASDHWCVVETAQQSGVTRYRYGSITKLKELMSSDVVGYHSGAVYPHLHD